MARLDDLEFRITASTTELRGELARGSAAVQDFAKRTESGIERSNVSLKSLHRTIREVVNLYGVISAGRAFARWIADATQLDKLTQTQANQLKDVKLAMDELQKSTDDLAQTLAVNLAPSLERAARFWREFLFPTGTEATNTRVDFLNQAIKTALGQQDRLLSGNPGRQQYKQAETIGEQIAAWKEELEKLRPELSKVGDAGEKTLGQLAWDKKLDQLKLIEDVIIRLPAEMQKIPRADFLLQEQTAPARITDFSQMKLPEGMMPFPKNEVLDAWDTYRDRLKEAKRAQQEFATAFAATFESRGVQAFLDGDLSGAVRGLARDFAELVLKLVVLEPLAKKIAKIISEMGKDKGDGGSGGGQVPGLFGIFAGAFGGGRASGGPVAAGVPYMVGERGPELFVPNMAGRIARNGSQGVTVIQHNHFDVALESVDDRIKQAAGPISAATAQAVMKAMSRPSIA